MLSAKVPLLESVNEDLRKQGHEMHLHFMQLASCFLDLTEFIVKAALSLDLLIHVFLPALG